MRGRVHTEEDCRVSRHYDYSVECGCLQVESGVERNREGLLFSGAPTVLAARSFLEYALAKLGQ